MRSMRAARLLVAILALFASRASAAPLDWDRAAAEETVTIATTNEDGTPRETTVWLVVVDATGFVRTGGTRWGDNAERHPAVTLRIAGEDHALRAERVTDPALIARVDGAFREKYGTSDRISGFIRFGGERIFRLAQRSDPAVPTVTPEP